MHPTCFSFWWLFFCCFVLDILGVLGVMREGSECYSISAWRRKGSKKLTVAQRILWQACSALLRWQAQDKRTKCQAEKGVACERISAPAAWGSPRCSVCQLLESPLNDFANRISPISQAAKQDTANRDMLCGLWSQKGVHLTVAKVNRKLIRSDLPDLFVPTHNRNYSSWNFH